jgi:predicted methyltransferase
MTMNQRQSRSPDSRVKQVLMRLQHEAGAGSQAITSFAAICDMISIPRDLRAGLLEELVREGYVTRERDTVHITEVGKALVASPPD